MSPAPIVITMGEPAGIGGEVTLKARQSAASRALPTFAVLDDATRLSALAVRIGCPVPVISIDSLSEARSAFQQGLPVLHRPLPITVEPGRTRAEAAPSVIAAIEEAADLTLAGTASALVTNPINKAALYAAGFSAPGHTEFLAAHIAKRRDGPRLTPIMMLTVPGLRVVPVTIHTALADAIRGLTMDAIIAAGVILGAALARDFSIAAPRIAVAGLNPHAGEAGALGREEIEIIAPACNALRDRGLHIEGPLPADTLFHEEARRRYDAVLCMYHDQGLIPLKTIDFARGVNVTLGLPIVRTSPDHGTAFDIAGTGRADPASLIEAIALAGVLAANRTAP